MRISLYDLIIEIRNLSNILCESELFFILWKDFLTGKMITSYVLAHL